MARLTVQRVSFNKIVRQLTRREELDEIKEELAQTKVTLNPKKDSILWDPTTTLTKGMAEILEREITFQRNKEGCAYKLMEENIIRLRKYAEGNE